MINKIIEVFKDCEIVDDKIIVKHDIAKVIDFVKANYNFDILKEIIAIDKKEEGIELNYNLYSTVNEENVLITILTVE